jgi:hypothetical protein
LEEEMKAYVEQALRYALEDSGVEGVEEVVSFEEKKAYGGGCETCYYEYVELDITYLNAEGARRMFTYEGSLAELLSY